MSISKILFPFVTLGVSAAVAGNYVGGGAGGEVRNIVKATVDNSFQTSKIAASDETKDIQWKLLFSSTYNTHQKAIDDWHLFYSGKLSNNQKYQEQANHLNEIKEAEKENKNYTGKVYFDISKDIDQEKATDYLNRQNNKLGSESSESVATPADAFQLLKEYTKNNETQFKEIFGNDVYNNLIAWNWNWKQK